MLYYSTEIPIRPDQDAMVHLWSGHETTTRWLCNVTQALAACERRLQLTILRSVLLRPGLPWLSMTQALHQMVRVPMK